MTPKNIDLKIDDLFEHADWVGARKVLEGELRKNPDNHWLITQLGVTFYEQQRYSDALQLFLRSAEIVPDCPLTLWNLAGTLDAIGKHSGAVRIYNWILESTQSADDDPCWESPEWSARLKADSVYRLGVCYRKLRKSEKAEQCFHCYLQLLSLGIEGSYSIDHVRQQMLAMYSNGRQGTSANQLRKKVGAALLKTGPRSSGRTKQKPPRFNRSGELKRTK